MSTHTQEIRDDLNALARDARALMVATADVAEEKVVEARERLGAALERGKESCGWVRDQAVAGARVADEAVHRYPYQLGAAALGVGMLLGCFISRRWGCDRE
jgi:ElaB/YqjD/DUF883 family membrane-anchored ribosome-binding protein